MRSNSQIILENEIINKTIQFPQDYTYQFDNSFSLKIHFKIITKKSDNSFLKKLTRDRPLASDEIVFSDSTDWIFCLANFTGGAFLYVTQEYKEFQNANKAILRGNDNYHSSQTQNKTIKGIYRKNMTFLVAFDFLKSVLMKTYQCFHDSHPVPVSLSIMKLECFRCNQMFPGISALIEHIFDKCGNIDFKTFFQNDICQFCYSQVRFKSRKNHLIHRHSLNMLAEFQKKCGSKFNSFIEEIKRYEPHWIKSFLVCEKEGVSTSPTGQWKTKDGHVQTAINTLSKRQKQPSKVQITHSKKTHQPIVIGRIPKEEVTPSKEITDSTESILPSFSLISKQLNSMFDNKETIPHHPITRHQATKINTNQIHRILSSNGLNKPNRIISKIKQIPEQPAHISEPQIGSTIIVERQLRSILFKEKASNVTQTHPTFRIYEQNY